MIPHSRDHVDLESRRVSEPSRTFLEHFPQRQRSLTANVFCYAVRRGARTVDAVLAAVRADVEDRLRTARRYREPERIAQFSDFLAALTTHRADARAYAQHTLEWEALGLHGKEQVKQARGAEHQRRWMETQPPTDRQIEYLRALGWFAEVRSKAEASDLIDRLRRGGDVA